MLTLTPIAVEKIREIQKAEERVGDALRITAEGGGGCGGGGGGISFGLSWVRPEEERPDDKVYEQDGLRLVIDPVSYTHVLGNTVDYVEGPTESGFKVERPTAELPSEPPTGPIADKIQQIIKDKINPGVASHGGWVELIDLKDDTVFLRLGGGCQGCGMVDVTLKQGIQVLIQEEVPSIKNVYDLTDHANGQNPYYQPSAK